MLPAIALAAALAGCAGGDDPQPLVGTLEWDRIALVADRAEPVRALHVREGDAVSEGQVVAELDGARAGARAEAARAALGRAEARLAELVRGPRREAIDEAQASLEAVAADLANAETELARVARLQTDELVSRTDLDRARARRDALRARHAQARAALAALLDGTTVEELEQARASVAEAAARLSERELDLGRLTIAAPLDGVVEALPFEVGEQPAAGAAVAVLLGGPAPYARVYVPEALRARVVVGTAATVHVSGYDRAFEARVRRIAAEHAFTPYYALTERDRGRLSWVAELVLDPPPQVALPAGVPVRARFTGLD